MVRHTLRVLAAAGAAAWLAAVPAQADPTLLGRTAMFSVLTFDDPAQPMFEGALHNARVAEGIEFGLLPEGPQGGLDVVPVIVDISAHRIEIDFSSTPPGTLVSAAFNGYVLSFTPDCLLFDGAAVDRAFTTAPLADDAVIVDGRTLFINMSGMTHRPTTRIGIELAVTDCPLT